MKFRKLKPEEIEARVAQVGNGWVQLLLYKDARCDMNILDETVSEASWQREHYECKGNLFCRVGIRVGDNWIWKSDCGTESYSEKQKGEASDSFKRACVNWGIGRELYTAPSIFINVETENRNGKNVLKNKDFWEVSDIQYEGNNISYLEMKNTRTKKVDFKYGFKK